MAPQASQFVSSSTVQSSASPTPTPADPGPKPWVPIPVAFSIFIGVCLAYALSYLLYRVVMSRRRESPEDTPDSPDRGVSQFMNGARLTLNFGHHHKSTPLTLDETPHVPDEEKPLTDPPHAVHSEVPANSLADPSTPFIVLTPSFTIHSNEELGEARLQEQELAPTEPETPLPSPTSDSHSLPSRVKTLSKDRVEAIALDPKLRPVQGPLRPLSMVPSPTRKERTTLFGLGLKHPRSLGGDSETDSEMQ